MAPALQVVSIESDGMAFAGHGKPGRPPYATEGNRVARGLVVVDCALVTLALFPVNALFF